MQCTIEEDSVEDTPKYFFWFTSLVFQALITFVSWNMNSCSHPNQRKRRKRVCKFILYGNFKSLHQSNNFWIYARWKNSLA